MQPTNRILGGVNVTTNKYPWVVSLHTANDSQHHCTGSIISRTAILTAAHCSKMFDDASSYLVVLGSYDYSTAKYKIGGKKVISHPNFNKKDNVNDAMIIILKEPIEFSKTVGPICLPSNGEIKERDYTLINFTKHLHNI